LLGAANADTVARPTVGEVLYAFSDPVAWIAESAELIQADDLNGNSTELT
jgi:hypothetical protein